MIDPRRIEVIDDATVEALRRLTPAERWRVANEMVEQCRKMVEAGVRSAYPKWTAEQVREEVARRLTRGAA